MKNALPILAAFAFLSSPCAGQSLRAVHEADGSVGIEAKGLPAFYQLESSSDLQTWEPDGIPIHLTTDDWERAASIPIAQAQRFFRLVYVGRFLQILKSPPDISVKEGESFTLTVTAIGEPPLTYQWFRNSAAVTGATNQSYQVASAAAESVGAYKVTVSNPGASVTSDPSVVTMIPMVPTIATQPSSVLVKEGQSFTLRVTATGTAPLTYEWFLNEKIVTGAASAAYTVTNATPASAGSYKVKVTGGTGGVNFSQAASVTLISKLPILTAQPLGVTLDEGQQLILRVTATGAEPLTFQWLLNGDPIPGATSATYTFESVTQSAAGSYTVTVTQASGGTIASQPAAVIVTPKLAASAPESFAGLTIRVVSPLSGTFHWVTSPSGNKYIIFPQDGQNGSRGTYTWSKTSTDQGTVRVDDFRDGTMTGTVTFTSATSGEVSLGSWSGTFTMEAMTSADASLSVTTLARRTIHAAIVDGDGIRLSDIGGWQTVVHATGTAYTLTALGFLGDSSGFLYYRRTGNASSTVSMSDSRGGALSGNMTWYSAIYGELSLTGVNRISQSSVFKIE